jgi:hypothetical protein
MPHYRKKRIGREKMKKKRAEVEKRENIEERGYKETRRK